MKKSEIFKTELELIHSELLRSIATEFLDREVPDYFILVASSSTGKHHPSYTLGYGGLVRHTKAAVKIADTMLDLEQYSDLPHDEILVALLLHDTFKHGESDETGHTSFDHPLVAANKLKEFLIDAPEDFVETRDVICSLISSHMGQWNTQDDIVLPKPITEAQKFVHLCDYLASRKFIAVEVE